MFLMPTLKANVSFLLIHRELDILKLFKQIRTKLGRTFSAEFTEVWREIEKVFG